MSALYLGIVGTIVGSFVLGTQVIAYVAAREKLFSRFALACGIIGLALSLDGLVSAFPSDVVPSALISMN